MKAVLLIFVTCLVCTVYAKTREYVSLPGIEGATYSLDNTSYVTWEEAHKLCLEDGAHLAIVNSADEMKALIDLRYGQGIDKFLSWVGFHDLFTEGAYVTVLDESLQNAGYEVWYPGYPYDSDEVNCGGILSLFDLYGLVIYTCTAPRTFICEKTVSL